MAAQKAEATALETFQKGGTAAGLPTFELEKGEFMIGRYTITLLRTTGFVKSNGEARRKISEGAVRINDEKVLENKIHRYTDNPADMDAFKVQIGKKRIALVKPI